uniref:FAS1 domain-containing protein n=1 Tax=Picea sitchensis TaxID=3332 RepID=A9NXQ4_PICSI|nr:unknown [Picea sitchensis]
MDYQSPRSIIVAILLALFIAASNAAALQKAGLPSNSSSSQVAINSNSVLVALLDSHYTELAELVEKALLLQTLEEVVGSSNVTIFAPQNDILERKLDPEFKRFLHEPGNLKALQKLLMFHVVPRRIVAEDWRNGTHQTLAKDRLKLSMKGDKKTIDLASVAHPNAVVRPDGVIHGIDRMLIPKSVQDDFSKWRSGVSLAVMPQGAPVLDPIKKLSKSVAASSLSAKSPPIHSIYYALAPGPSLAPAPAPGPSTGHYWFDGESQVKDFINTLVLYGGYNEMADILVNLTSLASELAKLVSEGYKVTVLAPNDEAMGELTTEQLSEPGAQEHIMYYHIIPEYQTEESMYNAVRRFGKMKYDTLRIPHKITSQEADGTVLFGEGEQSAHLFDHDIYVDGRISVQGIDKVLFPPQPKDVKTVKTVKTKGRKLREEEEEEAVNESQPTRGRLLTRAVCGLFPILMPSCQ